MRRSRWKMRRATRDLNAFGLAAHRCLDDVASDGVGDGGAADAAGAAGRGTDADDVNPVVVLGRLPSRAASSVELASTKR